MYTALGEETLKTGERLQLGVVDSPDPEWSDRIVPFLGHKNSDTCAHIRRALEGPLDELCTRFYVGQIAGQVVTEVMVVSARGVGILGHVYTLPEHRRKGAYSCLMPYQMADLPRGGIRLLCLSTKFESAPYWIYHGHGFRSIGPGRGQMIWRRDPTVEDDLFSASGTRPRPLRWDDWPWMDLLGMQPSQPDESLPRCAPLGLKQYGSLESAFVPLMLEIEQQNGAQAAVLQAASGATAGFALVRPDRAWFGDSWIAGLYAHPRFARQAGGLLDALSWPDAPCAVYLTPGAGHSGPWERHGFKREAVLSARLDVDGQRRDVEVWTRR